MDDFSFFFTFFSLLLGLVVAEIASKFADAIDAHPRRPLGIVTPLLATFFLFDIGSFWLWTWTLRHHVVVSWELIFLSLIVAMAYYLSGALVFPREPHDWDSLDHHYWQRKRHVLAGLLVANLVLLTLVCAGLKMPELSDGWFFFWQLTYYIPIAILWFSRSRRLDIAILVFLIVQYQLPYLHIFPNSQWGQATGINDALDLSASTSGLAPPK